MDDLVRKLKTLHSSLIGARSGFEEGLKDSQGKGLAPLFSELMILHEHDAGDVARQLNRMGAPVRVGSVMESAERAEMKFTFLATEPDERGIPSVVDGERRVLWRYDEAIKASAPNRPEYSILIGQRDALAHRVARMSERASHS